MNKLKVAIISMLALTGICIAADYDVETLKISNVTTGSTADTVSAQIAGKIERITVTGDSGAGVDWSIKSLADGVVLYSGTNLSASSTSSTNQAAFIGLTLTGDSADATNKNLKAVVVYSK